MVFVVNIFFLFRIVIVFLFFRDVIGVIIYFLKVYDFIGVFVVLIFELLWNLVKKGIVVEFDDVDDNFEFLVRIFCGCEFSSDNVCVLRVVILEFYKLLIEL